MKLIIVLSLVTFSSMTWSSEWAVGPISLGERLSKVEKITSVKSEYAGGCGVILLNKETSSLPFYAAPYLDVELWFNSTNPGAKLGSIVLTFPNDKYQDILIAVRLLTGKDGRKDEQYYIFENGTTNIKINKDNNFFEIRLKSFVCKKMPEIR
jgi:hypothetical protein